MEKSMILNKEEKNDQKEKNDHLFGSFNRLPLTHLLVSKDIVSNQSLPFEARVSLHILNTISNRYQKTITKSSIEGNLSLEYLMDIYNFLFSSKELIFPSETTRTLLRFINQHGIVSANMIARYSLIDNLSTKKSARLHLRRLEKAGFLDRYSTDPMLKLIKKPFANLKRTELYGFKDLDESAYKNIVEFYSRKTEEAHEDEIFKAYVKKDKKLLVHKVEEPDETERPTRKILNPEQLYVTIESYQKSIDALRMGGHSPAERDHYIPIYEKKILNLKKRLKEMDGTK